MDMKVKRGQILKELRNSKGLSQAFFAKMFDISQAAYQKYEYGTAEPSFDTLCKLADFYGVTTDYLLGREKPPEKPDVLTMLTQEFHLTELEKALVQAYIAISPKEREKFIQSIEETVKQKEESQQQAPKPEPPIVQSTLQNPPQPVESLPKQRHVERLGDIEDELEQERKSKEKGVI